MLVQFGDNWIQKIPLTTKLDSAYGLVQFWLPSEFFFIQLFLNWTACSPITYTNIYAVYRAVKLVLLTKGLVICHIFKETVLYLT